MQKYVFLALLLFLTACSVKYVEFKEDSLSVQYPDWQKTSSGNNIISVQKGSCKVDIGIQDSKFNPSGSNIKIAVDISIIPALRRAGLSVDYTLSEKEAVLELAGNNVYGKQKYIACNNKLYKVSAACSKNDAVIDYVINSAKCSA